MLDVTLVSVWIEFDMSFAKGLGNDWVDMHTEK